MSNVAQTARTEKKATEPEAQIEGRLVLVQSPPLVSNACFGRWIAKKGTFASLHGMKFEESSASIY